MRAQVNQLPGIPVPVNTAFTVTNNVKSNTHRFVSKEIIGYITLDSSPPANGSSFPVNEFPLRPGFYKNTRAAKMAESFQKFRYLPGTKLVIQNSCPTTTPGHIVTAYTPNPDMAVSVGNAERHISSLEGATSTNVWVNTTIPMHRSADNRWYNIDDDSEEIMNIQQGKFLIVQAGQTNLTGPIRSPVWLESHLEFTGAGAQSSVLDDLVTATTFPRGTLIKTPGTTFPQHGCQITNLQTPDGTATDRLYSLDPGFETIGGEAVEWAWVYLEGASKYFLFAKSEDDAKNGQFLNHTEIFGAETILGVGAAVAIVAFVGPAPNVARILAAERERRAADEKAAKRAEEIVEHFMSMFLNRAEQLRRESRPVDMTRRRETSPDPPGWFMSPRQ